MIKHSKCSRLEDDRTRHLCSHYLSIQHNLFQYLLSYPFLSTPCAKSSKIKNIEIRVIQACEAARAGKKKKE
jgi:hypothetical protein